MTERFHLQRMLVEWNCRSLGCAPNDTEGMAWSATTPLKPKEGLNGHPNPWLAVSFLPLLAAGK